MRLKTLTKLTTTVALTFGFVAANAAYPVGDSAINGTLEANQALNCYNINNKSPDNQLREQFRACIKASVEVDKAANKWFKNNNNVSLVDSIKQAKTTGSSFTSKQYDDYARMANVMTFENASSDANLAFKKQLANSAQDYIFKVVLDTQNKVAYEALRDTQNQATNQAILTTLLAMSDTLNQIKNHLNSNACVTGNCTVKASTEKEVLSKLSPDELRAMALGILDGLSKQNSGVEIPVFEGTQLNYKKLNKLKDGLPKLLGKDVKDTLKNSKTYYDLLMLRMIAGDVVYKTAVDAIKIDRLDKIANKLG